jgi:diguanylate cyclase (GGDEF)-like protein
MTSREVTDCPVKIKLVPIAAVFLALAGTITVTLLSARADSSRRAQFELAKIRNEFEALQGRPTESMSPGAPGGIFTKSAIDQAEQRLIAKTQELRPGSAARDVSEVERSIRSNAGLLREASEFFAAHPQVVGGTERLDQHAMQQWRTGAARLMSSQAAARAAMDRADAHYSSLARRARVQAIAGTAAADALLLLAFAVFYRRSQRLTNRVRGLLGKAREEAFTDSLTGLPNRRALMRDVSDLVEPPVDGEVHLLVLLDLDGFKLYNDTFGHPAGDALLARVASRLAATVSEVGTAYRMGGDEFCVLARCTPSQALDLGDRAAEGMSERGEGFSISASSGAAQIHVEATSVGDALRLADQRLYAHKKGSRPSAGLHDVLRSPSAPVVQ